MSAVASPFADLLAPERLLTGSGREQWKVSGHTPGAVALPVSEEEVAGLLERAAAEGCRVVPAGAGTALCLPGVTGPPDLVLSAARMERIVEYEPADLTVTADAGITLEALDAATRENGQWLPLDPPGGPRGTLGGLLATGSAGPLQAGFGTPRDHVLGLRLVTGEGRVLEVGGRVVKNVAGYDLVRLATGSGGCLGVVTRATVRLHPVPEADAALILRGRSMEELTEPARRLATAPVIVAALELAEPGPESGRGAVLAARVVGSREAVDHALDLLAAELPSSAAEGAEVRRGPDASSLFRVLGDRETGGLLVRLALLPDRLEELLDAGRELVRAWGQDRVRPAFGVHVSRGRLRVAVPELPRAAIAGLAEAVEEARARVRELGGSVRVAVGPPELMAGPAVRDAGPGVSRLVAGIREAFDPAGILPAGEVAP